MSAKRPIDKQAQDALNRRLAVAINAFKMDEAKRLLKDGADPNYRQTCGEPLLVFVASFLDPASVQTLIEYGADVQAHDIHGVTPLEVALDNAEFDNAHLLIKHGADLNFQMVGGGSIPPFAAAIIADRMHKSTLRTEFILQYSHAIDFDVVFQYERKPACTIVDVVEHFLQACNDSQRPYVAELHAILVKRIADQRAAQQEARMKEVRKQHRDSMRKRNNPKFKL